MGSAAAAQLCLIEHAWKHSRSTLRSPQQQPARLLLPPLPQFLGPMADFASVTLALELNHGAPILLSGAKAEEPQLAMQAEP